MTTIKKLAQMISEPASKEWFAKHGKKANASQAKKTQKSASMNSTGRLAKAEKGEKPVTGKEDNKKASGFKAWNDKEGADKFKKGFEAASARAKLAKNMKQKAMQRGRALNKKDGLTNMAQA